MMDKELLILSLAAKEFGVSQNYLRFLIFKKKLRATKVGRNWYITREWLRDYFRSIESKKIIKDAVINEVEYARHALENPPLPDFTKVEARLAAIAENLSKIQASLEKTVSNELFSTSSNNKTEVPEARQLAGRGTTISSDVEGLPHQIAPGKNYLLPHLRFLFKEALPLAALSITIVLGGYLFTISPLPSFAMRLASDVAEEYWDSLKELTKSASLTKSRFSESIISSLTFIKDGFEITNFAALLPRLEVQPLNIDFPKLTFAKMSFSPSGIILNVRSFFSEVFKPSPPPPTEIAIPKQENTQNPGTQSTNKAQSTEPPTQTAEEVQSPRLEVRPLNIVREVVERRETLIPADLASVKQELLSSAASLNNSIKDELSDSLRQLADLRSLYSRLSSETQSQTRIITLSQKIDNIGEVTLSNVTFSGTSNQFNLKDADIPDDISVTGSINPSSLTVSNTFTVSGTGTSTFSGGIKAAVLDITSTTATSTFSNGIQLSGGCFRDSLGNCITPGGSNTHIQFNSSGAFQGDSNLIWDNTNKRLGLGTTTPASLLSVHGNSLISGTSTVGSLIATSTLFVGSNGNLFNVFQNGFVGIGTTSPGSLLSIQGGNLQVTGTSTTNALIATSTLFVGSSGQFFNVLQSGLVGIGTTSPGSLLSVHGGNAQITGTTTASGLIATSTLFVGSSGNLFNVLSSGFTGIGTTSPGSLLSIHGGNAQITGTTTASALIATSTLFVGSNGNLLNVLQSGFVGIGTTSPSSLLSIQGIGNFVQDATSTLYTNLSFPFFTSTSTIATSSIAGSLYVASSTPTQNALFAVGTSSPSLWIDRNTGRLGVGTSSPGLAFSVQGDILGSGILNLTGTGTSTISGGLNIGTLNITSTTATSTFGNGIQLSTGGVRFPDGRTQSSAPVFVRKTADETVNNSTTLQNDDALFLAMAANETWYFTANIIHNTSSVADIKYTFTVPTGATIAWNCTTTLIAPGGGTTLCPTITTSGTVDGVNGAGIANGVVLVGVVVNGATAGNLQFQWAQNTAEASDTKVLANSYLEAHK